MVAGLRTEFERRPPACHVHQDPDGSGHRARPSAQVRSGPGALPCLHAVRNRWWPRAAPPPSAARVTATTTGSGSSRESHAGRALTAAGNAGDGAFQPSVGDDPHQGDGDVDGHRQPAADKGQPDARRIQHRRQFPLTSRATAVATTDRPVAGQDPAERLVLRRYDHAGCAAGRAGPIRRLEFSLRVRRLEPVDKGFMPPPASAQAVFGVRPIGVRLLPGLVAGEPPVMMMTVAQ